MIAAIGTALFFAMTPVFASRAAHLLGSLRANLWRLIVAGVLLGAWAHIFGAGLTGAALPWFVTGGVVGFGIGGVAMFKSLPRIGPTLSTLIVQCLSAISAALVEWLWLGTRLTWLQATFAALTLAGVIVGLMPRSMTRPASSAWRAGLAWALLSAIAQGAGAVLSRKAFAVAAAAGDLIDPGTAAYQRVLGGLVVAILALVVAKRRANEAPFSADGVAASYVLANALTGPVLGVTCYQWALRSTPAGLVQPIVATAPLLTIPFALWFGAAAKPRPGYYLGATLAVIGATGIMLTH